MRSKQLMIALVAVFFLLPLLGITGYQIKQNADMLRATERAVGTITGFNTNGEPIIAFEYQGKQYQISQHKVSDLMKFEVGIREEILVEPLEPEQSTLNRFGVLWGGVTVTAVFSALIAALCLFMWRIL